MDPNNLPERDTPHWNLYQRECFIAGTVGTPPAFSTNPEALQQKAHEKLTSNGWNYAMCNAGLGDTHKANREAFQNYRIVPRMLRETNVRDTTIELFGHKLAAPICFAPIGINKIYHPLGELPVAKVAGELGLGYTLSTAASNSIEDVAAANGNGPRFFQLYMPHDDELTISLLTRAVQSGFTACMLTVDTWQLGYRHDDVATANYAFYSGIGCEMGWSDPVFQKRLAEAGIDPKKDPKKAGQMWIDNVWHGKAWTWEKMPWLIAQWKKISNGRPFLIKGIQHVDDAKKALEVGCEGIVVSNHAGRQVDGAISSLDALAAIVDAVGKDMVVLYDSGVRSAADAFKALAIGAKAVFIGRLWVWGLSIQGEFGVRHVMRGLLAELDILMNVAGYAKISDINRSALVHSGPVWKPLQ